MGLLVGGLAEKRPLAERKAAWRALCAVSGEALPQTRQPWETWWKAQNPTAAPLDVAGTPEPEETADREQQPTSAGYDWWVLGVLALALTLLVFAAIRVR